MATWSFSVIGLSTETVKGTVLQFSAISGRSIVSLPSLGLASPKMPLTACYQACSWSCASALSRGRATAAKAAAAATPNARRVILSPSLAGSTVRLIASLFQDDLYKTWPAVFQTTNARMAIAEVRASHCQ